MKKQRLYLLAVPFIVHAYGVKTSSGTVQILSREVCAEKVCAECQSTEDCKATGRVLATTEFKKTFSAEAHTK